MVVTLALLVPLPAEARPRCFTPEMHTRAAFANAGESDRPVSVGYVDSALYPIRVHYRREDDAERAADVVIPAAEHAWAVEVDEMGWPAPAADGDLGGDTDRFDLYLTNEDTYGGAWTWGPNEDVNTGDDWYSVASFIALDERGITDEDMGDFVAHEFNHSLQYTIDGYEETGFVWESTAEAMEELVTPDTDLYFLDIPYFNELPFESLLFDSYSDEVTAYDEYSTYEYGGAISGLYLEKAFGNYDGTTLLQLWLDLAQGDASNEPDYVDALGMIGGDAAPTYEDVYLGIAEWRMFIGDDDDGAHYDEGHDWGRNAKVATEDTLTLSTIDGTSVTPVDEPYDLGTSYWVITVDDSVGGTLHFDVAGADGVEWGVVAAAWQASGPAVVVRERSETAAVSADLDLTGATQVMVGVADLGKSDLNAEGRHPRNGFTLSFRRDPPGTEGDDTGAGTDTAADPGDDTGADPDGDTDTPAGHEKNGDEEPGGCGCDTTPGGGAMGVGAVLLALAGARRRRS